MARTGELKRLALRIQPVWLLGLGLALLVGLVFVPNLNNGLVSDDWLFVYEAAHARRFADVLRFFQFSYRADWYVRPTQWLATWLIYQVAGARPLLYHAASLLLHLANVLLLGTLAVRLMTRLNRERPARLLAPWLVALFFLINWRNHEAVFWYSGINELLSAFFRLAALSLLLYAEAGHWRRRLAGYLLSMAAFVLALLSKESSAIFPAEVTLLLVCLSLAGDRRSAAQRLAGLAPAAPFLLVAAIWAANYLSTSARAAQAGIARGGLALATHATPRDLVLRFVQYFNGSIVGLGYVINTVPRMLVEIAVLGLLLVLAIRRRRYAWVFALFWAVLAVAPYASMTGEFEVQHRLSIVMLPLGGDRYFYYAAAAAALLLTASVDWFLAEARILAPGWRKAALGLVALPVAVFLVADLSLLVSRQAEWKVAGGIATQILDQVVARVPDPGQGLVCIGNLPDNYRDRFVFRNCIQGALMLRWGRDDVRLRVTVDPGFPNQAAPPLDQAGCAYLFVYDEATTDLVFTDLTKPALSSLK